eukprot:comp20848_c0_seq1/m.43226 comp20848_c0_seq1/g.43226  ORF comp20848_c0_seq1/g.43226 comp20848_c0_seq1/m.43226 type:complete len:302 (-) comp20848_c0_seq1:206-1111(-)
MGAELVCAVAEHEAVLIDDPEAREDFVVAHALVLHAEGDGSGDALSGGAGAHEDDALVSEGLAWVDDFDCGEEPSEGHCACALDVVVEAEMVVSVALEHLVCDCGREVLELHTDLWPSCAHRVHEFVDDFKVLVARDALLADAEIPIVAEQPVVVCADIEHHGQHARGMQACGNVQCALADRNSHPVRAKIAQSKDASAVCDNDDVDFFFGPIIYHCLHVTAVQSAEMHSARASVHMRKLQTCLSHSRGVNNGGDFLDVVDKNLEKQGFISVPERMHDFVLVQRPSFLSHSRQNRLSLLVD